MPGELLLKKKKNIEAGSAISASMSNISDKQNYKITSENTKHCSEVYMNIAYSDV